MEKSNLDVAFELVSRKKVPVAFSKLWEEVSQIQGLSEEEAKLKAGKFYTSLTLDGRFITLGENTWDLRNRHTFDKTRVDMNSFYSDDYDADEVEEDDLEELDELEEDFEKEEDDEDEEVEEEF